MSPDRNAIYRDMLADHFKELRRALLSLEEDCEFKDTWRVRQTERPIADEENTILCGAIEFIRIGLRQIKEVATETTGFKY